MEEENILKQNKIGEDELQRMREIEEEESQKSKE